MKIAMCDNNGGKFTTDLKEYWEKKGHEVKFERGASESLAQWCDLYYCDTFDNNIHYLYKHYHNEPGFDHPADWDSNKKPLIVVRALDWEVWIGLARGQELIDWVDKVIVIVPHIEDQLRKHAEFGDKIRVIRPGVNTDKFTLKESKTDGFQVGMALGDMWWPKNHMGGLDIFNQLSKKDKRWHLHIRGNHEGGTDYWKVMYDHYISSRGLEDRVTLYSHVPDMNQWYENIDYLLHPGMKEAFCYAVGEAMSKGIKPIVNEFYGSRDIWPDWSLYQDSSEALKMFHHDQKPEFYRDYIKKTYPLSKQMEETDAYLGL